jgi:prepilin-type N-terminal cleavage/methylation domain-containing protein
MCIFVCKKILSSLCLSNMNKNKNYQQGFSAIELLIVLVVIVLVGVAGWYAWNNHKTTSTTKTTSQSTNTAVKSQNYFIIKEWGVRAVYTGSLHLQYTISDGDSGTNTFASVTSTELLASDSSCQGHGGGIERYLPNDTVLPANEPAKQFFAQQSKAIYSFINGYYYSYISPQMQCSTKASATSQQQQNQTAVESIASKLEAVPAN